MTRLHTDYLVIGAGAASLAFVDELLCSDPHAQVTLVERRAAPGGHWLDAYDFVRLHQPAAYYGVNSMPLGQGGADLASKAEILSYFSQVVQKHQTSGRLKVLYRHEHLGGGRVRPLSAPDQLMEIEHQRLVDGTYSAITVPSTTPPRYEVDPDVRLVPVNGLTSPPAGVRRHVIIGAGKTGIDAILYLLDQGVAPEAVQWITPRDAWLVDRAQTQVDVIHQSIEQQMRCMAQASSEADLGDRLEAIGYFFRLHAAQRPTAFRCATVSQPEFRALQTITDIVRMGRVTHLTARQVHLTEGVIEVAPHTLFVDCTADGLARRPPVPIFGPEQITLQPVVMCQATFSGAITGRLEARLSSDAARNACVQPVPHPNTPADHLTAMLTTAENLDRLGRRFLLWMLRSRLYPGQQAGLWRNVFFVLRTARVAARARRNLARLTTPRLAPPDLNTER